MEKREEKVTERVRENNGRVTWTVLIQTQQCVRENAEDSEIKTRARQTGPSKCLNSGIDRQTLNKREGHVQPIEEKRKWSHGYIPLFGQERTK